MQGIQDAGWRRQAARRFYWPRRARAETLPPFAVRRSILILVIRRLLISAALLLAGCAGDPEDRQFFNHGWVRPRMTTDDQAYFYGGKSRSGGGPEEPRLPSGEVPQ